MSAPHIILDNLPSLCQKLSDLVEVWRSYKKIILLVFLDTVYKRPLSNYITVYSAVLHGQTIHQSILFITGLINSCPNNYHSSAFFFLSFIFHFIFINSHIPLVTLNSVLFLFHVLHSLMIATPLTQSVQLFWHYYTSIGYYVFQLMCKTNYSIISMYQNSLRCFSQHTPL